MIPDLALQHVVASGLRTLKRDPRRLEQLFANLPADARAQVRDFIVSTPIHLTHGYPTWETPKLPNVVIALKREDEAEPLLGQAVDPGPLADEEFLLRDADLGAPRPPPREDPGVADHLIEARDEAFPEERIPLLYGEDELISARGRIERLTYDVEVRTQEYFATAFLHRVIKALFIDAVPTLEAWGIHSLVLAGSDLQHVPEHYPHLVFARVLMVHFDYLFGLHDSHRRLSRLAGDVGAARPGVIAPEVTLHWELTIA